MSGRTPTASLSSHDKHPEPRGPGPFNPFVLDERLSKGLSTRTRPPKGRQPPWLTIYRSISWMFGFRDTYSLLIGFICGGALIGFALGRSQLLNPSNLPRLLVPGEWFFFHVPLFRIPLIIHIYMSTIVGLFAGFQFLPTIRRRKMILHRMNGYGVLGCLGIAMLCGAIVGRRAFGGELNAQSAYYIQAIMVVTSGLLGVYNVKRDTRRHRKWMLRMVAYFATAVTARLLAFASRAIITRIGSYFSSWRCDELLTLLSTSQVQAQFPSCLDSGINTSTTWVSVHASTSDGPLFLASSARAVQGMALWIATVLHMAVVEIYIANTDMNNQVRLGFVLEPLDFSDDTPTGTTDY